MKRLVRRSLVVPDCAATHPHWFVQLWIEWARLVFANRERLDRPIRDLNGHTVVRALPEWHLRPYCPKESAEALDRRRADFMQNVLATLLVGIAHMSFRSKVVLPDPRAPDYMSLREWGAELPALPRHRKGEVVYCADPIDAIERPMRFLKTVGVFSFTKQHRQKLENGRFLSFGSAIRRYSLAWMMSMHGMIAAGTKRLQEWLEVQDAERAAKEQKADEAFTDSFAKRNDPIVVPKRAPAAAAGPENSPDLAFFDQVEREHPEWIERQEFAKVNAEVRRLKTAAAVAAPNTS